MDGPPPPEEDFTSIPIAERLAHKNWKARVNAYESLIKTFQNTASDTDPAFKPYINNPDLLKKIATDANAVAQEKGVECLVALVKFAGETSARTREAVVPALVDKCLGSARAGTKTQSLELILQYAEVENSAAGVVNDVLAGLGAKQPKAVAGCVLTLKELVRIFGTQVVPSPPILKALPKIFAHADKAVRAEGTNLTQVLYQWIGPGIEPWLGDLKPVQVKELKDAFEGLEKDGKGHKSLKQERLTRAGQREAEAAAAAGEDGEAPAEVEQEEEAPPDPRAFAEPEDIIPKLPNGFYTNLKSSKWKERKEALDDLATLVNNTARIKEAGEIGELARSLATCVAKDANINCVIVAANCLDGIAKGMMAPFAKYREAVVPPMLERLKERKANVTDAIGLALDAIFKTTTLVDILPDLDVAFKNKNPQVKEGALKFLGRSLSTATTAIPPAQVKPLAETLAVLLEDGFEGARTEAATCFGTLMKMVGERPLNAVLDTLPDMRKAKVKEAFDKATVKCKASNGPPPRAAAPPPQAKPPAKKPAAAKPPPVEEPVEAPEVKKAPVKAPPKAAPPKKPAAASAPAPKKLAPAAAPAAASKAGAKAPAPSAGSLDSVKYKHSAEEADALAADLIPGSMMTDLADANWKTRLAALDEMTTWVDSEVEGLDAEVVVRALAKKGWAEKNFQVSAKIYGVLSILAEKCPSFGRSCVAICAAHLSEKLGDLKLKKPAGDTLIAFAERTSLQLVFSQMYEPLSKQKAPKVLADSITWMTSTLIEFGIAGLSLRSLIDFLKSSLGNANAAVRTNATKAVVQVKIYAGAGIKDLIEDLNPQLLNTITSEFDKVEGQTPPEPTRTSAELVNIAPAAASGGKAAAGDPLDELFPRVDLDGLFKGTTILTDAKGDAWKTKKEALEALQSLLDQGSNKRLKSSMGEIGQILKARVTDANKPVQMLALDIVSRIATGMGKPFDKHSRLLAPPICTVCSDQKANIRALAVQTLTAIGEACVTIESMIPGIATGLESTNPLQKATLLGWALEWFKAHPEDTALDLQPWAASVVASLDDRNSDVRKNAQALLPALIASIGFDAVMQQTNSLKPASRSSATPLIQAARGAAGELAPCKATSEPKAKPAPEAKKPIPAAAAPPSPPSEPAQEQAEAKPATKLGGIRRKLPIGSRPESRAEDSEPAPKVASIKRPAAAGSKTAEAPAASPASSLLFINMNADVKKNRIAKDAIRWINEGGPTRKDLADLLQSQMDPNASKELVSRLFSLDHNAVNDHITGLGMMADFYSSATENDETLETLALANLDLPLKYISIKAFEPQPNLVSKCLDVCEAVLAFLRHVNYQLTDNEALLFIPTVVGKLGDAREPVRVRVSQIIRTLTHVYAYSRVFQLLLEHGLKAKVAKTRQGTLDEMSLILKKSGMGACDPGKALPQIAALISDKDPMVRKSALGTLGEAYSLIGDKVWQLVGSLSSKDKTQLEERLRRIPAPATQAKPEPVPVPVPAPAPAAGVARLTGSLARPASPSTSKLGRPASPAVPARATSPVSTTPRAESPSRPSPAAAAGPSTLPAAPLSPTKSRPRSLLPSRLARPGLARPSTTQVPPPPDSPISQPATMEPIATPPRSRMALPPSVQEDFPPEPIAVSQSNPDDITVIISTILSSDANRSVDALKRIQKILSVGPEKGPSSPQYRELAEHTETLVETITLQMAHVFTNPDELILDENFRLAKHLIQTLNNFCDHSFLAESLTVETLTSLLEELTLRLLETDDNTVRKIKDLSRFINMIVLRLFATGRRMSVFRALFALLLQIVKPFPANGTLPDSKEAKVAELVLKCVWKLARNMPIDLEALNLDPVELFPAIETFLQSVPPNEWRARATNRVPCGDMPLRTIKVIIQHVVAHYGDDVYELLSASFEDPSATIVYPYVYRILNSSTRQNGTIGASERERQDGASSETNTRSASPVQRSYSPQETASVTSNPRPTSHRTSASSSSVHLHGMMSPNGEEPDPDAQLLVIIGHISSETTGALHKEGITELHHFLKAHPDKRPKVERLLESTGPAFRKYINRALASRAAEDQERNVAVAQTLSKLEQRETSPTSESGPKSPTRSSLVDGAEQQERLSRLHDIFQYRSSNGRSTPSGARTSLG